METAILIDPLHFFLSSGNMVLKNSHDEKSEIAGHIQATANSGFMNANAAATIQLARPAPLWISAFCLCLPHSQLLDVRSLLAADQ